MPSTSTTPDVAQLRAEYHLAADKRDAITKRASDIRVRLPQITDEQLPSAIADGDDKRANVLRAERASAEGELRDLDKAERIASARADTAARELARAELPTRIVELKAAASDFRRTLAQLQRDARRFVQCRGVALQTFGRADIGGKESQSHPSRVTVGEFGAQVMRLLADVGDLPSE